MNIRAELKSSPTTIRVGKSLNNFLRQKAIDESQLTEKGKPNIAPYMVEKLHQCWDNGWDSEILPHNEAINLKTKSEVMLEMGDVYEKSLKFDALCEVLRQKSHNGLDYYLNELTKKQKTK